MARTASSNLRKLILDGTEYPVSPEFADSVQGALGTLEFDLRSTSEAGPRTSPHLCWEGAVQTEIESIMRRSNHFSLTENEHTRLAFLTHVRNIASTVRAIGAHHDPVKEWGFDGWDAVHGNLDPPELCGCQRHYVFDYHSATNHFGHNRVTPGRKHHEIEPRVCETHGGVVDHSGAEEDWDRFEARES